MNLFLPIFSNTVLYFRKRTKIANIKEYQKKPQENVDLLLIRSNIDKYTEKLVLETPSRMVTSCQVMFSDHLEFSL